MGIAIAIDKEVAVTKSRNLLSARRVSSAFSLLTVVVSASAHMAVSADATADTFGETRLSMSRKTG
ncbi:hypothetical protein GB937_008682 [Aspergillus fischeri]|nr:hypothetical protein GB937_008682 [Aspergillus fischeri]